MGDGGTRGGLSIMRIYSDVEMSIKHVSPRLRYLTNAISSEGDL